jgi:hypothetical protein
MCTLAPTVLLRSLTPAKSNGLIRSSNDTVYCCSQEGKTTVLKLEPAYRLIATNQLDGIFLASPAVAGKSIFLRSDSHLYRIESP